MIDLIPSLLTLIAVGVFISRLAGKPVLQVFISIVAAYVVVFPAIDFYLSPNAPVRTFALHQTLSGVFFILPMLFFIVHRSKLSTPVAPVPSQAISLNILAPLFLLFCITAFVAITYGYDLYLVRINYTEYNLTTDTPAIFLAIYRIMLESSFFVILYLLYCIRTSSNQDQARSLYKATLVAYLVVFGAFFLVNSRMQFLTLLILVGITIFRPGRFTNRQLALIVVLMLVLMISLTILREVFIEQTNRLDISSLAILLNETVLLIAGRLNSMVMVDMAGEFDYGFNPFAIDLSGLWYSIQFNASFLTDPETYASIRQSEVTSPSVYLINSLMLTNYVDFPKAMIVDVFLTFGVYGLPVLAYALAAIVVAIQKRISFGQISQPGFVIALYVLPLVFQFEKEFLGFLTYILKWSPMLIALLVLRPEPYARPRAVSDELRRA